MRTTPTKRRIKWRIEPQPRAIHKHGRHRQRRVGGLLGDALRYQPTQQRVPALVGDCLRAVALTRAMSEFVQSAWAMPSEPFWDRADSLRVLARLSRARAWKRRAIWVLGVLLERV